MFLGRNRIALAKTLVGILAVVVIIVGAVVVYPTIGLGTPAGGSNGPSTFSRSSSSSSVSSSSAASATSSATTATTTPSTSPSSASSVTTTTSSTSASASSSEPFGFTLVNKPDSVLITPGGNLTYAHVNVLSLPSAQLSGSEIVSLAATAPAGISIHFVLKTLNISINSQMSLQGGVDPPFTFFTLAAAPNLAPGDYRVTVVGTSGSLSESTSFTVRVVQNLVIVKDTTFNPPHLTIKAGTTVYWLNLGLPTGGDNAQEYDVSFATINARSTILVGYPFYDSFSYTFTTPGTYQYFCAQTSDCVYPNMKGDVTVTA